MVQSGSLNAARGHAHDCWFGTIPAVSGPRLPDVRRASAPVPLRKPRARSIAVLEASPSTRDRGRAASRVPGAGLPVAAYATPGQQRLLEAASERPGFHATQVDRLARPNTRAQQEAGVPL